MLQSRPQPPQTLKGIHGEHTKLPVLNLQCTLLGSNLPIQMDVSNDIPHDILLGRNCPTLFQLLRKAMEDIHYDVLTVQTRHQACQEAAVQQREQLDQENATFQPSSLEDLVSPLYDFPQSNHSLQGNTDPQTPHTEAELDQHTPDEEVADTTNATALAADQTSDETLATLWALANKEDSPVTAVSDVLHRQSSDQTGKNYLQLILPLNRRQQAHSTPMASHVGTNWTNWPGIDRDVTAFCRACDTLRTDFAPTACISRRRGRC